jgi:hypothetical protein
MLVVVLDVAV